MKTSYQLARSTTRLLAAAGGLTLLAGTLAASSSAAAPAGPVSTAFGYTGALQSYVVPSGICAVTVTAQAGSGGGTAGGKGAVITASVRVPAADTLSVLVGAAGGAHDGGFGGGGGGAGRGDGGGGGGASVVATSAALPLVVAGGGGGSAGPNGTPAGDGGPAGGAGGGFGSSGGTASGDGGFGTGGSGSDSVGGGGGGVGVGGAGGQASTDLQQAWSGGRGGSGTGNTGGGGGGVPELYNVGAAGGLAGSAGSIGGAGPDGGNGDGRGGEGGGSWGGGGGIGFGGGGGGDVGGGGAGWGGGGGGGSVSEDGGGGGSSHVAASATGVSSSAGTGNGQVTITYDPATDTCPGTPGAPTAIAATGLIGAAEVSFTAPSADGGSPITSYLVTATDLDNVEHGGQTATGAASPITMHGLYPGDHYAFTAIATNAAGDGLESGPSSAVMTAELPGAPTAVTAHVDVSPPGSAEVSFAAPDITGGAPVTAYTVTAIDATNSANGGQVRTGAASPLTVTGLTAGDSYTFTVQATTTAGAGPASDASNAVTATGAPELTFTSAPSAAFTVRTPGTFQVTTTGTSGIAYAEIGALPNGVTFSAAGLLGGTPSTKAAGTYPLTIVAVSSAANARQSFTLTVLPRR